MTQELKPYLHIFLQQLDQGESVNSAFAKAQEGAQKQITLNDVIEGLSTYFDGRMLHNLECDPRPEKVRDRIGKAVLVRLQVMDPHKQAIGKLVHQGLWPHHGASMVHMAWKTADEIWYWAGDESTDFNHYTKRGLLLTVMAAGLATWLKEAGEDLPQTKASIDKALARVLQIPKIKEKVLTCLKSTPFIGRFF